MTHPLPPVLAEALDALGEEDGKKIAIALADKRVPAERIAFALAQVGHPVSPTTIRTYRRQVALAQSISEAR